MPLEQRHQVFMKNGIGIKKVGGGARGHPTYRESFETRLKLLPVRVIHRRRSEPV